MKSIIFEGRGCSIASQELDHPFISEKLMPIYLEVFVVVPHGFHSTFES